MKLSGVIVMYPNVAAEVYGEELTAEIAARINLLEPPLSADGLLKRDDLLGRIQVIFSGWGAPIMDEAFLLRAPDLRAIFYAAGTIRDWVTDAVWRREIVVTTASSVNAIPVAEYTQAAILLSLKNVWRYAIGAKRQGRYETRGPCAGAFRTKVGLVSLGLVARLVADRLRSSDVEVFAYDPLIARDTAAALGVTLVSLEKIFRECDVVSVHAPQLPATRGLIGREHFRAMKPGATFINSARGEIVREADLMEVFADRGDLTAVLDVTAPEPPVLGSPLYDLPNVVLTPHLAGSVGGECRRLGRAMVDEFDRWIAGEPLRWQITRTQAALTA